MTMFCPNCGSMVLTLNNRLKCRKCGHIEQPGANDLLKTTIEMTEREITIVEDETMLRTLPTMQIKCPECSNNLAFWWLRQLRAADESEVRFFRCTVCNHTWREYD